MVSNDQVLKEVVQGPSGLLQGPQLPKIHISMSTISPDLCDAMEKLHREKGVIFLAAPVTGRPRASQRGGPMDFSGW